MMAAGFPEFVGYWVRADEIFEVFRMFIDNRKDLENSVQKISGRIKDKLGNSTFSGTISPNEIEFIKSYTPQP